MKMYLHQYDSVGFNSCARRFQCGFTLTELMVTMAIFFVTMGALLSFHLFGLRLMNSVQPDTANIDKAVTVMNQLGQEVRSARNWRIGFGSANSFYPIMANQNQQGSALQIYPTNNEAIYIRYYLDTADAKLKRVTDNKRNPVAQAETVQNPTLFQAEDMSGNAVTNYQSSTVLAITLQLDRGLRTFGNCVNYFELKSRIISRAAD